MMWTDTEADRLLDSFAARDGHPSVKKRMPKALVVEDDPSQALVTSGLVRRSGFETAFALSANEALGMASKETYDLFVVDLCLPDISGEQVISSIRAMAGLEASILAYSATSDPTQQVSAMRAGASDLYLKGGPADVLLGKFASVAQQFHARNAERERTRSLVHVVVTLATTMDRATAVLENLTAKVEPIHQAYMASQENSRAIDRIRTFIEKNKWAASIVAGGAALAAWLHALTHHPK